MWLVTIRDRKSSNLTSRLYAASRLTYRTMEVVVSTHRFPSLYNKARHEDPGRACYEEHWNAAPSSEITPKYLPLIMPTSVLTFEAESLPTTHTKAKKGKKHLPHVVSVRVAVDQTKFSVGAMWKRLEPVRHPCMSVPCVLMKHSFNAIQALSGVIKGIPLPNRKLAERPIRLSDLKQVEVWGLERYRNLSYPTLTLPILPAPNHLDNRRQTRNPKLVPMI
jgi:hypothetical protein